MQNALKQYHAKYRSYLKKRYELKSGENSDRESEDQCKLFKVQDRIEDSVATL
jgi:hypothetical protein